MESVDLIEEMTAVVRKLNQVTIPYAQCGGLAIAFHGFVCATQDIDFLVRPEHLSAVMNAVGEIGYTFSGGIIPAGDRKAHPCEIHRLSKIVAKEWVTLDFVLANPSLEPAWESRQKQEWLGEPIWVVSRDGLGVMKRLSHRPIDLSDLQALGIPVNET